jgi:hypothetical protein
VSSFIFNALIMNIYMFALTYFMVDMFSSYVRGTDIALIFEVQVKNMRFYKYFLKYNVFIYCLTVSILSLV